MADFFAFVEWDVVVVNKYEGVGPCHSLFGWRVPFAYALTEPA